MAPQFDLSFCRSFWFAVSIGTQFHRAAAGRCQAGRGPSHFTGQERGMSFPKKGKSFPNRGTDGSSDFGLDDRAFAGKIGSALRAELKTRNAQAKQVARWTGANERTVKNWISGRYAPCGRHLVLLAQLQIRL